MWPSAYRKRRNGRSAVTRPLAALARLAQHEAADRRGVQLLHQQPAARALAIGQERARVTAVVADGRRAQPTLRNHELGVTL
jgi:hypothetical protein